VEPPIGAPQLVNPNDLQGNLSVNVKSEELPKYEFAIGTNATKNCADSCSTCMCCACFPKIGNMTPLLWGAKKANGYRKLLCMVGPFWPVLVFVTYPLIFLITGAVANFCLPHIHMAFTIITAIGFGIVVVSLGLTAFVDPGMAPVTKVKPGPGWSYSDQAKTFRPKHAFYCNMCKVVIQEYDHTCPWTGTGIGKYNFSAFKIFAGSVCCLFWYLLGVVAITIYTTNNDR
jgi:hypothetical protein